LHYNSSIILVIVLVQFLFTRFWVNLDIFTMVKVVATLALGSRPRQGGCKVAGQQGSSGVTFHVVGSAKECERMNPHTPEWIPCWELESKWIPRIFKAQLQGLNPSVWRVIYIIEKLLKRRCLKWAHMTHLDI
jgi:hypothetical protein